ncbi:MAG: IS256 family transposase, partial [Gaiellaceae bacterium]
MAETKRMTVEQVVSYLMEGEGLDFLRESLGWMVQQLMEAEVTDLVGAGHGERAPEERLTHRNGYRARTWATRAGEIELAIPKIRRGSYFPSFLDPRRRSEQALVSVVQEAYVAGVSTRKVDQVVESLGLRISKSEVSRICQGLDEQVEAFRQRPLEGRYPYLWLDAKIEKVRDGGRVVRKALVLAYAVHESGYREVIGLDVGEAETEAFWRSFLRSLVERGLTGVQLVVSDAHPGLKKAIAQVLSCPWQRCTVHFLRELLGHVRRDQQGMLSALIRPIFQAETGEQARELVTVALERLEALPKIHELLSEAEDDLLGFYFFPSDHWPKLRSTNNIERVNKEIGRRSDVVGIFPNDASIIRLIGSLLIE